MPASMPQTTQLPHSNYSGPSGMSLTAFFGPHRKMGSGAEGLFGLKQDLLDPAPKSAGGQPRSAARSGRRPARRGLAHIIAKRCAFYIGGTWWLWADRASSILSTLRQSSPRSPLGVQRQSRETRSPTKPGGSRWIKVTSYCIVTPASLRCSPAAQRGASRGRDGCEATVGRSPE